MPPVKLAVSIRRWSWTCRLRCLLDESQGSFSGRGIKKSMTLRVSGPKLQLSPGRSSQRSPRGEGGVMTDDSSERLNRTWKTSMGLLLLSRIGRVPFHPRQRRARLWLKEKRETVAICSKSSWLRKTATKLENWTRRRLDLTSLILAAMAMVLRSRSAGKASGTALPGLLKLLSNIYLKSPIVAHQRGAFGLKWPETSISSFHQTSI